MVVAVAVIRKNLDKLKALRIGDQAVFLHSNKRKQLVKPSCNHPSRDAYCLLLLNLEGVCKAVVRVSVLPLVTTFGSAASG